MEIDLFFINTKIGSAHYKIANNYYTGNGVVQDFTLALRHYKYSADTGNIPSQNNLGAMYLSGEGTIVSITNAQKYFKIAADNGSIQSQYNLASLYLKEHTTKYSKRQAVKYLEMAVIGSYIPAINLLASIYQYGKIGIKQDLSKSIALYIVSADKNSAPAQNELGIIYSTVLTPRNHQKAIKYFTMASLAGFTEAKYNLATMYQNSEGLQQDLRKSFQLYADAANDGHVNAMYNLAIMYKDGSGVEEDILLCVYWFKKCALIGDVGSMYNLGLLYSYGFEGTPPDLSLARHWLKKASELFCGPAIAELESIHDRISTASNNLIFVDFK